MAIKPSGKKEAPEPKGKKTPAAKDAFLDALKGANKIWKKAKERYDETGEGNMFQEFPDGRFLAKLKKVDIGQSMAGRRQIIWSWQFMDGDYKGQTKMSYDGIETEENLFYVQRALARFGYEVPEDIETVAEILAELNKTHPVAKIVLKTRGEFQNVYINQVYAEGEAPEVEESEEAEDEAEVETDTTDEEEEEAEASADVEEEEEEEAEEEEEEEDEAVELEAGMNVRVETSSGEKDGECIEVLSDEGKARVKLEDGKIIRVAVDKISVLTEDTEDEDEEEEEEEEEEEVPEEPKKKAKGKPAPAPPPAPIKKKTKK